MAAATSESPMLEMKQMVPSGWRGSKPVKVSRRRILCPTLPRASPDSAGAAPSRPWPQGHFGQPDRFTPDRAQAASTEPLNVTVRLLYFSKDGSPADTGAAHDFCVPARTTVDSLLQMARSAAGVGDVGRLIFRGKPLTDGQMTLEACNVDQDPKAIHLMLARKHRPQCVAAAAAAEAEKLAAAMREAEAQAAARPPREKRVIADLEDDSRDELVLSARSVAESVNEL
eukprot:TRINITY_DN15420_c0_g1_i1.p1 TRINITY_DN15420_c0_g1~~TRINITY_DN15420_c0_g1_i1.p1  ORF type:complete len:228 (+),score=45.90 TRINITY_DN15420_c0_g1_i1:206-889(+)